jgi:hypothetical protein
MSFVAVPSDGGATLAMAGVYGAYGPVLAVVNVLVADHALAPAAFAHWSRTSTATPAASPDRSYGLVTPDTNVQTPAPDGLDCRLKLVATPWVLSTAGAVQVTTRLLPAPWASDTAAGMFGICAIAAVVSVLIADHALVPAVFELWIWTSIAAPAAKPDRLYGLVVPTTTAQIAAPEGLDRRLKPVAALCRLSTAGAAQVTARLLPEPRARDGALGMFGICGAGAAGGEVGCAMGYIVPDCRCVGGVLGYVDICDAVPVSSG